MTKKEFLEALRGKLKILKNAEVDDILTEYSQHIDMKIEAGLSEEEATRDFGDIDELAAEILDAYNVNAQYGKRGFEDKLFDWTRKAADYISMLTDSLLEKDRREVLNLVIKGIITILCLSVAGALVALASGLAASIFGVFPSFIERPFSLLIHFVFNVAYLALVIYVAYVFINHFIITSGAKERQEEKKRERAETEEAEPRPQRENVEASLQEEKKIDVKIIKGKTIKEKDPGEKSPRREEEGENPLLTVLRVCMKVLAVLIMIPVALCTFGVVVAFGALVVMVVQGYAVVGVTFVLLGCLIIGCAMTGGLVEFAVGGRRKGEAR